MKKFLYLSFLLATAGFLFSCGSTSETNTTTDTSKPAPVADKEEAEPSTYKIGDIVDDFSLENIDGSMVSLASLGEDVKGATIIFTCNHCPYAVRYEDRLVEISKKVNEVGYPIIAIMPNDPEVKPEDNMENMKKRAEEKGFDFPYVMDAGQKEYPKWGATRTPEVFVLQKVAEGFKIVYHGAIDDNHQDASAVKVNYIQNAIESIENGKTPDPAETKAIGCTIKVKRG